MGFRDNKKFQKGRDVFSFFIMSFINSSRPLKPFYWMAIALSTGITALASLGLERFVPLIAFVGVAGLIVWTVVYVFFRVFNAQNRFTQDYGQNFIGPSMVLDKILQGIQLGVLISHVSDLDRAEASRQVLQPTLRGVALKRRGVDMSRVEDCPENVADEIVENVFQEGEIE